MRYWVLATLLCLIAFQPKIFRTTISITAQLKKAGEDNFLESLIETKRVAFNINTATTGEITGIMSWSRYLLVAAIAIQLLIIILK
jgi:hypothetical protein